MMIEVPLGMILSVMGAFFVIVVVILLFTVLDLREDKKQLQWERNFHYENYQEYMSKYVEAYQELRKLKEKFERLRGDE